MNLLLCHVNLSMQLININLNDIILIYSSDDSFFYKPLHMLIRFISRKTHPMTRKRIYDQILCIV